MNKSNDAPPDSTFDSAEAQADDLISAAPAVQQQALPEANEFSPGQIDLRKLLETVEAGAGDRDEIIESLRHEFFPDSAPHQEPEDRLRIQRTRAYNALLGASKYGLVDRSLSDLTELGMKLRAIEDDAELHREFAAHILQNLNGIPVLLAIREMQRADEPIGKTSLQAFLENRAGFKKMPRATNHHTRLLQWLRKGGLLPTRGYEIDVEAVEQISGVALDTADAWAGLTQEQKSFLRTLRRFALVEGADPVPAATVVEAAALEYGPIFKRPDQLAAQIFRPLTDGGWITQSGIGSGRGGKSGQVAATPQLLEVEVDLLPDGDGFGIPDDLKAHLQKPLSQVYSDLKSSNTHTKGIALEVLAVRMAIDLTLTPTRLRERGTTTGGAEVDLVAEGAHLHFSRWLLQCKNTQKVHVAALAKEVGMAVLLKAHVIVIVSTGSFTAAVEAYAKELAATNTLQVVLVDSSVLEGYQTSGANALRKHFHERARETLTWKRPQVIVEADA